jgi:hypothetical protein
MSSFSSLIPIDRASPYLRTQIQFTETIFQIRAKTMDNIQYIDHWINDMF